MIINPEEFTKNPFEGKDLLGFIEDQHKRRLFVGVYKVSHMAEMFGQNIPVKKLPEMKKCGMAGCPNWFNHSGNFCCREHAEQSTGRKK